MTRIQPAARFRSFSIVLWAKSIPCLLLVCAVAAGCAKPEPYVTNVVRDFDVEDCSPATVALSGPMDVAIIVDTSQSTRRPSGIDVNGDGFIPKFERDSSNERLDSRLAAEIAALQPLVEAAKGKDIRFSIVTYSGASGIRTTGKSAISSTSSESRTRVQLTKNTRRLKRVLNEILDHGSNGTTVFFAGMHQGSRSLVQNRISGRRRVALLLSDSARPTALDGDAELQGSSSSMKYAADPRMKSAAVLAQERGIVFHTFGLSPDSETWRHHSLGQIAGATGGDYHAVEDAGLFFCHLADALAPAGHRTEIDRAFARVKRLRAVESETLARSTAGRPGVASSMDAGTPDALSRTQR